MQVDELTEDRLRQLARLEAHDAAVLSLFVNLDPSQFATPKARSSEIRSLLDEAHRAATADHLSRERKRELKADVERAERYLTSELDTEGIHGVALFVALAADIFEPVRLGRPVETAVAIDSAPFIEPLLEAAARGTWCVLLVNRRVGRMLRGTRTHLDELPAIHDPVHGWHRQGGLSQARYQRSIADDVRDHLDYVAAVALRRFRASPFDRLLTGGPEEVVSEFEQRMHSYLRERHAGRVEVDVENTSPDDISAAAAPAMERDERERIRAALDRLREGVATGTRAASGLDATLEAVNERRVETLLVRERFSAGGAVCPTCGWVGAVSEGECPADGTLLTVDRDVVQVAIERTLAASGEALVVGDEFANEIDSHGSIGAVLRF